MEQTLKQLLEKCEECRGKSPVVMYREKNGVKEIFFPEFWEDIQGQKKYYQKFAQRRIGLWAFNSYEWIVDAIAMLLAGKTVILLDGNLSAEDLTGLCDYTDVELVVADAEMAEEMQAIHLASRTIPVHSLACRGKKREDHADQDEPEAEGNLTGEGEFICFTSGTSRSAKGVVIPVAALCGCVRDYGEVMKGAPGEKFYLPLPYHHIYAFTYLFHIMHFGGVLCIGQMGRYLLEDLDAMRPETLFCVPSILKYLLEKGSFPDCLQRIFTGGSYLRPELAKAVGEQKVELYNLYGSSEVLGAIGYSTRQKGTEWIRPVEKCRFFLNDQGELGVSLPYHMKEYYRRPEETEQVLDIRKHIFWTGDAADIDEDGFVRIRGRVRDMVVLENGEKVHAEDTDAKLCALSGVADAAVIVSEGVLAAVLVPDENVAEQELEREIKRLNRGRPASVRIQKVWIRKQRLPRTATGKLRRFVLEQEYERKEGDVSADKGEV